ncbi:hypothetical protein BAE44_0024235 [Dichanthelium oligosanthes]|uniref:Uncharacterized protein n=1 Tax=Dichanthelium oligosanthes TaxID=888268 RepID=A0A1E5UPG1_9POAL|nr:hypothetical protein BAE44_0024235 [Dichanthelium oligosanthes]
MSLRGSSPTSSADEALKDELPRAVEREIQENARAISCPQPSWPGCCTSSPSSLVRGVTRRVFGVSTSSSTRSSLTRRSPPRSPRREQASSDITGKSGSAPRVPARTGSEQEARPEKDQATLTRPNREILGGQKMLPDALMHVVKMDERLGSSASCFAKVASVVAILSEFDGFRKSILDIGGMEMLRNLLKMEDPVVRKEAITAIHGLCRDQEGKKNAESYNVPDALLECLMKNAIRYAINGGKDNKNFEDPTSQEKLLGQFEIEEDSSTPRP